MDKRLSDAAFSPLKRAKEWTFKIILLGDSSVGKTSLLRRYANEETPSGTYKPTIGVDFRSKQIQVEGEYVKVLIWDTAGQERFRTMTKQYYRGSHGVILVYDVTNPDSFNHVNRWLRDFQKFADDTALKILVGNKCDVEECERAVNQEQGQLLSVDLDIPFLETSAKDDVNVTEVFDRIITDLVVRRKRRDSLLPSNSPSARSSMCSCSNADVPIKLHKSRRRKLMKCCYH